MTRVREMGDGSVDMFDVYEVMEYIRSHYNASIQVSFDCGIHDGQYGLLCITVIAHCGNVDHRPVCAGWSTELSQICLYRMPSVLHAALYDIQEAIDGACSSCLASRN